VINKTKQDDLAVQKSAVTLQGIVEKVIPSVNPAQPDKVEISVEGAEHLYREICVDNSLQDANGEAVCLKSGALVNVTIEADAEATIPAKSAKPLQTQPQN
jgi:hypothetical protein